MRGTFANVRIKNLMLPPNADGSRVEGGVTVTQPRRRADVDLRRRDEVYRRGTPTVVFGGEEYGTGISRDWAAKGTQLLGVKAVIAKSFERIHRSNLVGMGVLPLQFKAGDTLESLGIDGDETFDIVGLDAGIRPQMDVTLVIRRGRRHDEKCRCCCASTRRSRSTTTGTAASCRSCCASCLPHNWSSRRRYFMFDTRARNPSSRPRCQPSRGSTRLT